MSSLVLDGYEVLRGSHDDPCIRSNPMAWGCFPMVPWAGRVRAGQFSFAGRDHQLPLSPVAGTALHALHGTAYLRTWNRVNGTTIATDLGRDWPFGGVVNQSFELDHDQLSVTLRVRAGDLAMPAMVGWHPWFLRTLTAQGPAVKLDWSAEWMYELDQSDIPTGALVRPSHGPWDNCFVEISQPIVLRWPGQLELELTSDCSHWVVYDHPDDAVCVEPQSGPPDEFNQAPATSTISSNSAVTHFLCPGEELTRSFILRWKTS